MAWRTRNALGAAVRAVLKAVSLCTHVLGVGACSCRGDALGVVGEVGARAQAAEAIDGAVASAPDPGATGEAA